MPIGEKTPAETGDADVRYARRCAPSKREGGRRVWLEDPAEIRAYRAAYDAALAAGHWGAAYTDDERAASVGVGRIA